MKLSGFLFVFLISFNAFSNTSADLSETHSEIYYLLQRDYHDIKTIYRDLIRQYDPEKYVFVGIGGSPAPLITFIKLYDPSVSVLTIPFRRLSDPNVDSEIIRNRLRSFLDRLLKTKKYKGIVFIDYIYTGTSLLKVIDHAKEEFREVQIEGYGLFRRDTDANYFSKKGVRGFELTGLPLAHHLYDETYKSWTEYNSIPVNENRVERNEFHQFLVSIMQSFVDDDRLRYREGFENNRCWALF